MKLDKLKLGMLAFVTLSLGGAVLPTTVTFAQVNDIKLQQTKVDIFISGYTPTVFELREAGLSDELITEYMTNSSQTGICIKNGYAKVIIYLLNTENFLGRLKQLEKHIIRYPNKSKI